MSIPKRATGIFIATVLGLGVIATLVLVSNQVQADTIVPGFATAHVHLNVTVCETPSLPAQVKFIPATGKRYYFKDRTFELAPGLNTIEWYVRKIPGGKYKVTLSPSQGVVTPDVQDVTLQSDKVSDNINLSIFICEPTPVPAPTVTATATPSASIPDMLQNAKNTFGQVFNGTSTSGYDQSFKTNFINTCVSTAGSESYRNACQCTLDYIETHYSYDELIKIVANIQSSSPPQDMINAATNCMSTSSPSTSATSTTSNDGNILPPPVPSLPSMTSI